MISYLDHNHSGENLNVFPMHGRKKISNTLFYFYELC